MTLTVSHSVGVSQPPVRDVTIGDLLREAAADAPDRAAMIEGKIQKFKQLRQQWIDGEWIER